MQRPNQEPLQPIELDQGSNVGEFNFDEIVGEFDQTPRLPPDLPLWDELIDDVTNAIDDPSEWNHGTWEPEVFFSGNVDE